MKKKKFEYKKVLDVLYWIAIVFVVISSVFVFLSKEDTNSKYKIFTVQSGSMEPEIKTGSIIVIREEEEYLKNDIVTIRVPNGEGETYTHRISEVTNEGKLITKGDANDSADPETISQEDIIGKLLFKIPLLGYLGAFLKTQIGFIFLIIIPSVLIISTEIGAVKKELEILIKKRKNKQ